MHGVICETTKLAISDSGYCDFKTGEYDSSGSVSFKPINSSDQIKCSKLLQTGFQDLIYVKL